MAIERPTIVALHVLLLLIVVSVESKCWDDAAIFNFGDSNSDTGGLAAGMGTNFPPPEGRVFFQCPAGRWCDGRLIIDFLCESLNRSYLNPYLEALGSDFTNGANFAISGAATLPRNAAFNLGIQLHQFLHFRSRSLELDAQGYSGLVTEGGFEKALYMIDIGQNDLGGAFSSNKSYDQVIQTIIPDILGEIEFAIRLIHDSGGKKFWVHNTGPLGCLPAKLALLKRDDKELDQYGCLKSLNNAAKEFNTRLNALCDRLSAVLSNVTIVYADVFSLKYDLIANYINYGFERPLMSCCGNGGPPYNFDRSIMCGNPHAQVCSDGSKFISWDGVHYTEAANAIVASMLLSGNYSKPNLQLGFFCNASYLVPL